MSKNSKPSIGVGVGVGSGVGVGVFVGKAVGALVLVEAGAIEEDVQPTSNKQVINRVRILVISGPFRCLNIDYYSAKPVRCINNAPLKIGDCFAMTTNLINVISMIKGTRQIDCH